MAHRLFSSTLVVLTITLLISSLISSCVATPKLSLSKPIPKPIVAPQPKPVTPIATKPTETPVTVATKSSATLKASSSITTSSVVSQSVASTTSSIVTKSSVTSLSSTTSSLVSQKNATLSPLVTTSSSSGATLSTASSTASANTTLSPPAATSSPSNTTLPTVSSTASANTTVSPQPVATSGASNATSPTNSTSDPILPSSPLDLSNDPNDGVYFSSSIASREFLANGYDEESNRTVVRSAKWTTRRGEIPIHREHFHANLHKRVPTVCGAAANAGNAETYELDCTEFPNICDNACFFIACKAGAAQAAVPNVPNTLEFTLDRNNDGRETGECRGNNKCSATNQPRVATGWPIMSQTGLQCDEFPFNVVRPGGGPLAATRCVPQRENGRQGRDFQSFINAQGIYTNDANGAARNRIPDCDVVRVTPINIPAGSLCSAPAAQIQAQCTAASPGSGAAGAAQDINRQE